jgi:peptide deformylase
MKIVDDIVVLRQKSMPVESVEEASEIINKLKEVLSQTSNGVGLAAIQIGIPKTVAVLKNDDGFFYLVNPKVIEGTEEFIYFREGCLSFPELFRNTKRYRQLTFTNNVIQDDKFREETLCTRHEDPFSKDSPLMCIAIQHEFDHFEGKLLIDHEEIPNISIERKNPKIGRNEQCPCGSGKKYKKCCGK